MNINSTIHIMIHINQIEDTVHSAKLQCLDWWAWKPQHTLDGASHSIRHTGPTKHHFQDDPDVVVHTFTCHTKLNLCI